MRRHGLCARRPGAGTRQPKSATSANARSSPAQTTAVSAGDASARSATAKPTRVPRRLRRRFRASLPPAGHFVSRLSSIVQRVYPHTRRRSTGQRVHSNSRHAEAMQNPAPAVQRWHAVALWPIVRRQSGRLRSATSPAVVGFRSPWRSRRIALRPRTVRSWAANARRARGHRFRRNGALRGFVLAPAGAPPVGLDPSGDGRSRMGDVPGYAAARGRSTGCDAGGRGLE